MIYVTKPSLPPLEDFIPYLEEIWASKLLTNNGPFHQKLEKELCDFLDVKYISLFSNATTALYCAVRSLNLSGDVITTPFSFVATSHAIILNGLNPIFVDIDRNTFNIDPSKIERAITPKTTAIMAVHCYGIPCDVDYIKKIADKYNLKIIYDAAHAFGVKCHCGSVLNHGDLSILSFHATKVFNTFEGGAIISQNSKTKEELDRLKNFGFINEISISGIGLNGKMNEFSSALGLLQLKHVDLDIQKRKNIDLHYRNLLDNVKGIKLTNFSNYSFSNFSYFPILVMDDYICTRDELYSILKNKDIYARKYFYPLISEFSEYSSFISSSKTNLLNASDVSKRILCLPIYPDLNLVEVEEISKIIINL